MHLNERTRHLIYGVLLATAITLICFAKLTKIPDLWLDDALYQQDRAVPGDIMIIGIDDRDIDEFGPYGSWDRNIMASALEVLGSDPENAPAVVAIDIQYSSHVNEEGDLRLAKAAEKLGNVVTATTASYGSKTTFGSGSTAVIDYFTVLSYEEPYEELKAVTTQGSINTMYDDDGVLRHALLYVKPDDRRVYSMQYQAAKLYAESKGFTVEEPPTDARGHYYVSYSAKPGGFYDGFSLSDLINGRIDPGYYAGKLVLIGPYTPGLQDSFVTPIEKSNMMFGVEYQANVIQMILDGDYKTEVSDYIQLGVLWIVCLAYFVFLNAKKLRYTIPAFFIGVLLSLGISLGLCSVGYLTHAFWIPFGLFVLFLFSIGGHYIRAALERQNVTKTFERYVAPNVVNEILKEGTDSLKLGGKTVDIAVLFVDIRGFTTMSERLSPEEVVFILNQYLSMTSACVDRYQGTLDKFIGDATMAFWGAPIADDEAVYHACMAALNIVKGADELSAKLKAEINEEIHVGVGVNFGPAVVGNMGSERRMDYTAIGDTVNTSARLEANAPGGMVYVSRSVIDKLNGRMKYEPLEKPIKLKGKADGFEILRLIGPEE